MDTDPKLDEDDPRTFGHKSRWLINKEANGAGWLLHEPITDDEPTLGATLLPTHEAACQLFAAYTANTLSR